MSNEDKVGIVHFTKNPSITQTKRSWRNIRQDLLSISTMQGDR